MRDVTPDPLFEDIDQEPSVAARGDRAASDDVAVLDVQRPIAPRGPRHGSIPRGFGHPLDDRDELHEPRSTLVAQEPVDLVATVLVCRVHGGQDVVFDAGRAQVAQAAHHVVEGAVRTFGHAKGVVDVTRAVDRDPDQEVMLLEEPGPFVVELRAVGLDRVIGPLPRPQIVVDKLDGAAEELDAHQGWLAALPGDLDDRHLRVGLDQLPDVGLEQLVGHAEAAPWVQHLLGQEEAVGTIEVAHRPGRLREQMERRRRVGTLAAHPSALRCWRR